MATTKDRINITTNKITHAILKKIARRDRVPLATKAAELIEIALEIEEDLAFGVLAKKRASMKVKYIPHHLAWK